MSKLFPLKISNAFPFQKKAYGGFKNGHELHLLNQVQQTIIFPSILLAKTLILRLCFFIYIHIYKEMC